MGTIPLSDMLFANTFAVSFLSFSSVFQRMEIFFILGFDLSIYSFNVYTFGVI